MAHTIAIDFDRPIPLFALPRCVLLPHAAVPLHIFEPRYRAMTRDALDSHGLIAMAVFDGERWRSEYEGHPPLRSCVCVGSIVQHQGLDDGRYNLLLHGVCRARIVAEAARAPYRTARLRPLETADSMRAQLPRRRARIESLLEDGYLRRLVAVTSIHRWLNDQVPTPAVIDLATMTLIGDSEERYAMLAEPDPDCRARRLIHQLTDTRRLLRRAEALGPAVSRDGLPLN